MSEFPVSHIYDLGNLPQAGADVHIVLKPEALEKLARWADVGAVESFSADVELKKLNATRFALDVKWSADVVQSCVVTLEPVKSHLTGVLTRELNLIRRQRRAPVVGELPPADLDEDGPEDIDNPHYDLAVPILEDFALSIDPYPRKSGAAFESKAETTDKPESPFAALKSLKIER